MVQVTISNLDRIGGAVTAVVTGKLDAASADAFVQAILPVIAPRCTVVLEMAGVSEVTHAVLVALFRVALAASGLIGDDAAGNQAAFNRLLRADYRGIATTRDTPLARGAGVARFLEYSDPDWEPPA